MRVRISVTRVGHVHAYDGHWFPARAWGEAVIGAGDYGSRPSCVGAWSAGLTGQPPTTFWDMILR